jgi:hypothetical protein
MLAILNWVAWLYNSGSRLWAKSRRVFGDVYQLVTNEPTWVIAPNGVFFNNSLFVDGCGSHRNWTYSDNLLCGGCEQVSGERALKLPLLSCEFKVDGMTVSMDDFLEDMRYRGPVPSLAVLMAAFTIQSKTVHPWWRGEFTAFTKTGELVTFGGDVKEIPTTAVAAQLAAAVTIATAVAAATVANAASDTID